MGVERERVKKIKKVCKKMLTVQQTCYIINFVAENSNNKSIYTSLSIQPIGAAIRPRPVHFVYFLGVLPGLFMQEVAGNSLLILRGLLRLRLLCGPCMYVSIHTYAQHQGQRQHDSHHDGRVGSLCNTHNLAGGGIDYNVARDCCLLLFHKNPPICGFMG